MPDIVMNKWVPMQDSQILAQISQESWQAYTYVMPKLQLYRERIRRWNPQWTGKTRRDKVNINLIANSIDVLIASFWSNAPKVKYISRTWWIGQEEADNYNTVYSFDTKQQQYRMVNYQIEQDSLFFGIWIEVDDYFDKVTRSPVTRAVNPLSARPDPLPTQTGRWDASNYRYMWFMMQTNIYNLRYKEGYSETEINRWIKQKFDTENELNRQAYAQRGNYSVAGNLFDTTKNFAMDIYHHYTIIDGKKWLFVTDIDFWFIFKRYKLKPVLKEEILDNTLIPWPFRFNYYSPRRNDFFGDSVCDKLEDKQNAKSVLFNLNIMKAREEWVGWDYIVNSRLIKNKKDLKKPSIDRRYFYTDDSVAATTDLGNVIRKVETWSINGDTYNMMDALTQEAKTDVQLDALQSWLVPDKTMTKAEAQQIQAAANLILSKYNGIKSRFYQAQAFHRWRQYQEHFKAGQKKFALLNNNFEWQWVTYEKDEFLGWDMPYVLVWSADDIDAITEKQRLSLREIYPIVMNDPSMPQVSKNIFKRLKYRADWLPNDVVNSICPYDANERRAKKMTMIVNREIMPKSIFNNPNADFFTLWLYLQKANNNDIKEKILGVLDQLLIDQGMQTQQTMMTSNPAANSAQNIMMSQWQNAGQSDLITRTPPADLNNIESLWA